MAANGTDPSIEVSPQRAYERDIGFTHSHNDSINWKTHLEALEGESGTRRDR